jgi:hypothetical protein
MSLSVTDVSSLAVCLVLLLPLSLIFDAATHVYMLDGVVVPSVTGILKASGLIDFSGIPEHILEAARVRGTTVHEAIHFFNEDDLDLEQFGEDFPDYAPYLEGWIAFRRQRRFTPIVNECRIASRRHQVAGTLDCLGELDGVGVLLDFATGNPEDVAKNFQTAAYLGLALDWEHEPDADPRLADFFARHPHVKRYAVALRRDGTFRLEAYNDPADFRKFLVLVEAQKIVRARRGARATVEVV